MKLNSKATVMHITACSIVEDVISVPCLYGKELPVVDSEISKKIIMQTCGVKYSSFMAIYLLTVTVSSLNIPTGGVL
jgi:hypothetical protein